MELKTALHKTKVALITIGQSPRPDLSGALVSLLPEHVEAREIGLLDGLSAREVEESVAARPDSAEVLVTRLADGLAVTLDAEAVFERLGAQVAECDADGAAVTVILCTGDLPDIVTQRTRVLRPDRIVTSAAVAMLEGARVGVVVPSEDQIDVARQKWVSFGPDLLIGAASPFGDVEDLGQVASRLAAAGAQALILDCMAYTPAHAAAVVAGGADYPVLVSSELFAHLVSLLIR